jgi:protein gp37
MMGDNTKIEWTNATWNPVSGCSKVSLGCKHCYAERLFPRVYPGRKFTDVQTHPDRLRQPLSWRKPKRIFVNSMSDLFHEDVPDWFIANVFSVMEGCRNRHTFQILTKRPERMRQWVSEWKRKIDDMADYPAPSEGLYFSRYSHVWLGVSVENQETADARIPVLLQTPAAVRFLSCEPLLGPINLTHLTGGPDEGAGWTYRHWNALSGDNWCDCEDFIQPIGTGPIDWVIVGGESGPKSRPMHVDWARSIRDQCVSAGVAFFFKQWGAYTGSTIESADIWLGPNGERGDYGSPDGYVPMRHVGYDKVPAVIDGRSHREFPGHVGEVH